MVSISVCIGSACHLKGSPGVISELQRLIKERGLDKRVERKASFCLGDCMNGVCVKLNGELLGRFDIANTEAMFDAKVMPLVLEENEHEHY